MRFKINLKLIDNQWKRLPLNYQYELSAFIYRTIARGNASYSEWLHQNGFNVEGKQFRLFAFSNFDIPQKQIDKELAQLVINGNSASFEISFLPERSTEEFVKGIFANQNFSIGDNKCKAEFIVNNIEMLPQPNYNQPMSAFSMSPICITNKNDDGKISYLAPDDGRAAELIKHNLLSKYAAFYGKPFEDELFFVWQTTNLPKPKLITIKSGTPQQTKVKGYHCQFTLFTVPELMNCT